MEFSNEIDGMHVMMCVHYLEVGQAAAFVLEGERAIVQQADAHAAGVPSAAAAVAGTVESSCRMQLEMLAGGICFGRQRPASLTTEDA